MADHRRFVLCGHRGNMADSPENTLVSFASAERAGVDEIELDIRTTLDGELVLLHDHTVQRTAAAPTPHLDVPIERLTFDQARTIDLGDGQLIPTFTEALDTTSVLLQVEIKAPAAARPLARFLRDHPGRDRCLVTSFDPLSLADFRAEWTGGARGIALHIPDVTGNWRDHADRLDVSTVFVPVPQLSTELVAELHDRGRRVAASLIEGPGDVRRIVQVDVDATASNSPAYARRLLESDDEFTARFPSFATRA
ncbi:glycerophosphodiester phosphodiesterase [Amycolatopsis jejuensis]|uniref:glycerophosphodiester phosphodiesterase n=1 Tax=Amycolatopsis jejuensis TaxID=330084 RepID=UPI000691ADEF|nr:glycerophosphodiester phosphodiesterase [Amycolatopsis jejuensis]